MTCKAMKLIAKEQLNTQASLLNHSLGSPGPVMCTKVLRTAEDRMEHMAERLRRDATKED